MRHLSILAIAASSLLQAQDIVGYEYFFDSDPGIGTATFASVTSGDTVPIADQIDLTGLSLGVHRFCLRTKDADGVWSHSVCRPFFVQQGGPMLALADVSAAEYFFDTDPGQGGGTAVGLTPEDTVSLEVLAPLAGLPTGVHRFCLRVKDANGVWSHQVCRPFFINGSNGQVVADIDAAEYYFDTDPGQGNGTALSVAAGDTVNMQVLASTAGLPTGVHRFCLRVKDINGTWGHQVCRPFFVSTSDPQVVWDIVAAEYFFNTDPGIGAATPLPLDAIGDTVVISQEALSVAGLPLADHVLWLRLKDEAGNWGFASSVPFTVCETYGPLAGFTFIKDNNTVAFTDTSEYAEWLLWDLGDGTTDTLGSLVHTYEEAGFYDVCLIAANNCLPPGDTVCTSVVIKGINSIQPDVGGNQGGVTTYIKGAGFTDSTMVRLVRNDTVFIEPDTVYLVNLGRIGVDLNLWEADTGFWDVEVIIAPDTFLVADGFRIIDAPYSDSLLTISLLGANRIRAGFSFTYSVVCQNNGYNDASAVPVWLEGLPIGSDISVIGGSLPLDSLPEIASQQIPWDSLPSSYVDSTTMTAFNVVVIPVIPARSTYTVQFLVRIPNTVQFFEEYEVVASIDKPLLSNEDLFARAWTLEQCVNGMMEIAIDLVIDVVGVSDWEECLGISGFSQELLKKVVRRGKGYSPSGNMPDGPFNTVFELGDHIMSPIKQAHACAEAALGTIPVGKAVSLVKKSLEIWKTAKTTYNQVGTAFACLDVILGRVQRRMRVIVPPVQSSDPNAKYGPGAGSSVHYVNSIGSFAYMIAFENEPTATASAQFVTVIDTLDMERLDLSTFRFTFATVGLSTVLSVGPEQTMVKDIPLDNGTGMNARVIADLDPSAGIVTWRFFTIDPTTGQNTTDQFSGFLPPDTVPPLGQGYVGFLIDPMPGFEEGDSLSNTATIIFDFNDPIITDPWVVVLDTTPPWSMVEGLAPSVVGDSVFVQWSGEDTLSGVEMYTVMVSVDGEEYLPWLVNSSITSGWFHGDIGSTYRFYSLAVDSAGNVEEVPVEGYDTEVTFFDISTSLSSNVTENGLVAAIGPNPGGSRTVRVWIRSNSSERYALSIFGQSGTNLFTEWIPSNGRETILITDWSWLASGVYFIRITDGREQTYLRWVRE